ncbi:hypothetical protein K2X33_04905 [bacterium]|nr:hypothetical protein [bacterium]
MQKTYKPEELTPTPLKVTLQAHIVRDLKAMESNTKIPVDEMVSTALKMFIATHNDYLGLRK